MEPEEERAAAETRKLRAGTVKLEAEARKLEPEALKLRREATKLRAEVRRFGKVPWWTLPNWDWRFSRWALPPSNGPKAWAGYRRKRC